ncbi:MAG TPA: DUF6468 domain-containing protein [Caulobacteraceae bacterium]|nr:DUF6468 domain-containing protein [Caulobacteraceae bacterium]
MSLVGLTLDLLLAALLVSALIYGVRLERKLKALRDGQAGFAQAVAELNQAAARAEGGLEALRRATDEAHDSLHDRILKGRELTQQLEAQIKRAERLSSTPLAPAPKETESRRVPGGILELTERAPKAAPRRPAADEDLFEDAAALTRLKRAFGD